MKYAIETFDLTKVYGDFKAVDSLNMKIEKNSIFGFLGPNGAGKTTTIKMLTCLIPPSSGTARVAGYDILKNPDEVRQQIGMVPQKVSLYEDLTARENVEMCADFYGMPEDLKESRIEELMEIGHKIRCRQASRADVRWPAAEGVTGCKPHTSTRHPLPGRTNNRPGPDNQAGALGPHRRTEQQRSHHHTLLPRHVRGGTPL